MMNYNERGRAQIYRHSDKVAVWISDSRVVYFDPDTAEIMGRKLIEAANDCRSKHFTESNFPTWRTPSPEEQAALDSFARANGKYWKNKLIAAWDKGTAEPTLQFIRNAFGPDWLYSKECKVSK